MGITVIIFRIEPSLNRPPPYIVWFERYSTVYNSHTVYCNIFLAQLEDEQQAAEEENNWVDVPGVVPTTVVPNSVPLGLGVGAVLASGEELDILVQSLNTEQSRVFDRVMAATRHTVEHRLNDSHCSTYKPLRLFCTGVGGVGKSYLIDVIVAKLVSEFKTEKRFDWSWSL